MIFLFEELVPPELIANSPSRKDGVSEQIETSLRIYGIELIQEAGILLKLPQAAIATAAVLFHKFYYRVSMLRHNVKNVAMGSLLLSSKLEETPKKIRDICNVFYRIQHRRDGVENPPPLDIYEQIYWDMKSEIIKTERFLLKEMGFIVHVTHPHKYLLNYLKILDGFKHKDFVQKAWNYVNDSLRTNLCVRFRPQVIATSCIYLASRILQIPLPEEPYPWWILFDTTTNDIEEICMNILDLYSRPKSSYIDLKLLLAGEKKVGVVQKDEVKKEEERKRSESKTPPRERASREKSPKKRSRSREKEREKEKDRERERDRDRKKSPQRSSRDHASRRSPGRRRQSRSPVRSRSRSRERDRDHKRYKH